MIDLEKIQLLTQRDKYLLKKLVEVSNLNDVCKNSGYLLPHHFKKSLNKLKDYNLVDIKKIDRKYCITLTDKGLNTIKII